MKIESQEIHIWFADLSQHYQTLDKFEKSLSLDELKRADQYYFQSDREKFIISRGILRSIISNYLEIKASEIIFFYNSFGKPYVYHKNNKKRIKFNLAHSEELALYVIKKDSEVGIDIEKIIELENIEEIAQLIFNAFEIKKFQSLPDNLKLPWFFKCWTAKEAFVKAIGIGFSYSLCDVQSFSCENDSFRLLDVTHLQFKAKKWSLRKIDVSEQYEAAFVCEGFYKKIQNFKYTHFT